MAAGCTCCGLETSADITKVLQLAELMLSTLLGCCGVSLQLLGWEAVCLWMHKVHVQREQQASSACIFSLRKCTTSFYRKLIAACS